MAKSQLILEILKKAKGSELTKAEVKKKKIKKPTITLIPQKTYDEAYILQATDAFTKFSQEYENFCKKVKEEGVPPDYMEQIGAIFDSTLSPLAMMERVEVNRDFLKYAKYIKKTPSFGPYQKLDWYNEHNFHFCGDCKAVIMGDKKYCNYRCRLNAQYKRMKRDPIEVHTHCSNPACKKSLEYKRAGAKFCSPACNMAYRRKKIKEASSVSSGIP